MRCIDKLIDTDELSSMKTNQEAYNFVRNLLNNFKDILPKVNNILSNCFNF